MIGVVIPARNEEGSLAACLASVRCAASHASLQGEAVYTQVVLDYSTDNSARIVADLAVDYLAVTARNVGVARAAGAQALLARGVRWLPMQIAASRPTGWSRSSHWMLTPYASPYQWTTGAHLRLRCARRGGGATATRTVIATFTVRT